MRKKIVILALAAVSLGFTSCARKETRLVDYVCPMVGTDFTGHTFPGACVPFGMVQPGPDSGNDAWKYCSGFNIADSTLIGFSQTHLNGTGCSDLGDVLIMPTTGPLKLRPGSKEDPDSGYRSRFSHENETARPGYYEAFLDDYGIRAELTATPRVAFQRFSFPKGNANHILFDIGNRQGESGAVKDAYVCYTEDGRIEGWVITEPEYVKKYQAGATVPLYFSAVVDHEPDAFGTFEELY